MEADSLPGINYARPSPRVTRSLSQPSLNSNPLSNYFLHATPVITATTDLFEYSLHFFPVTLLSVENFV